MNLPFDLAINISVFLFGFASALCIMLYVRSGDTKVWQEAMKYAFAAKNMDTPDVAERKKRIEAQRDLETIIAPDEDAILDQMAELAAMDTCGQEPPNPTVHDVVVKNA